MRRLCRRGRCWRGGCEESLNAETQRTQKEERKRRKEKRLGQSPPPRNLTHAQLRASPEQSHRRSWKEEGAARDRCRKCVGCAGIGAGAGGEDGPRVSAI